MERKLRQILVLVAGFIMAAGLGACATPAKNNVPTTRISKYQVLVPAQINITPPSAGLPKKIKDLAGPTNKWGDDCWDWDGYPAVLIIKSISADKASVLYSYAGAGSKNWPIPPSIPYTEDEGRIIKKNGEYLLHLEGGKDAKVEMKFWREGEFLVGELNRKGNIYKIRMKPLN